MPKIFSYDKAWSSKQSSCQLARANAQSDGKRLQHKFAKPKRSQYKQTNGFFPYQIPESVPFHPEWESPCLEVDNPLWDEIFSQPFTYLGKGHQCFAFESQDHQYVLKLPYHSRFLPPPWLRLFPFLGQKIYSHHMKKRFHKLHKYALSYRLAFEQLREETALIYFHVNRTTSLKRQVLIKDSLGLQHSVSLDTIEFLLQKKATPLYPTLIEWMNRGEEECAKRGLSLLIQLFSSRYAKGIEDPEQNLEGNFGFLGTRPIQIDIGRLRKSEALGDKAAEKEKIRRLLLPLKQALEQDYPLLSDHLEKEFVNF